MTATVKQDSLLSNNANKDRFIQFLKKYFEKSNIHVEQAEDDADLRIVQIALQVTNKIPAIVAEDIDIFVLLSGLTPIDKKVYLLKPGKGQKIANVYSSHSLNKFPFCKKYILFFHAATGCDTTSSFFGKAKRVLQNL